MMAEDDQAVMSDQENTVVESALSGVDKPGPAIAEARQSRDWNQQELSTQTRLNINIIRALEADDFAALGQPVYARGYYRKCARILGLNEDELVRGYELHTGTDSLVPKVMSVPSIQYRERLILTPYILGAVLIALISAMVWWWFASNPADIQPTAAPLSTPEGEPAALLDEMPPGGQLAAPVAPPVATPVAAPMPARAEQAAADAPAQPVLRVELTGDSWVEIRDGTGERLVRALLQAGVVREFQGQPPYQVVLGDGNNVRIALGDRKVDFSGQIRSDRQARFQVGTPAQ